MKLLRQSLNAIGLPFTIARLQGYLNQQKKYLRDEIDPILAEAMSYNDGYLKETDLKKITRYYGLAVPAILGEAFCALQGRRMNDNERRVSTCLGAMTGLFDDFFDEQYLDDALISAKIDSAISTNTQHSNERLFDQFYATALQYAPDKKDMQDALKDVYDAQVESRKQMKGSLSDEEIWSITLHKGGCSLLFYRTAVSPGASETEKKLLYDLGGLMQLSNDIFDVYKDRESGISTLVTVTDSIEKITTFFKEKLQACFKETYQAGIPGAYAKNFLSILSLGIFSRCFVCLDQLKVNERFTENRFMIDQYNRRQLICDMDTKKNMLRSAAYHIALISGI